MIFAIQLKKLLAYIISILLIICILTFAIIKTISHATTQENIVTTKDSVSIPIIMYHRLLKDTSKSDKHTITPDQFESDLKYLQENGYNTVVMADLVKYVHEGIKLPNKPIVLTFDDGFYNNCYYGFELLKKYNMKAVLSIVGAYSEQSSKINEENANYSYVTWDRVKEISKLGIFEIQNHTYNLHSNSGGTIGAKKKFR